MAYINRVMLLGNLTKDPELKYIPSGKAVCDLRLAVSRPSKAGASGDRKEEVLFIDVTVWERTAELCAQYLKKGRPVYVEGRLQMDEWQDKDGSKRSKIRVTASDVQFLDSRPDPGGGDGGGGRSYSRGPARAASQPSAPPPEDAPDDSPAPEQPPMEGEQPF